MQRRWLCSRLSRWGPTRHPTPVRRPTTTETRLLNRRERWEARAFKVALAFSLGVLWWRWDAPLAGPHAFRQTQTAITVYWLLHGGPWINYWTPVAGSPWTAEYEFPLFQWIVAPFVVAGISLDNAGRLASWLFVVVSLCPIKRLAAIYRLDFKVVAILWLMCPLILYWGTSFLIETCSIFLAAWYLVWALEAKEKGFLSRKSLSTLAIGSLAAAVKGTSFVPFAVASLSPLAIVPFIVGIGWQKWTDVLKAQNSLSYVLRSDQPSQIVHNFGTIAERLSLETVQTIIDSINGTLGVVGLFLVLLALIVGWKQKIVWLWVLAFLAPIWCFPRLFHVHEYYHTENALFLIFIVAALLQRMSSGRRQGVIVAAIVVSQLVFFWHYNLREENPMEGGAQYIRDHTKPDDWLLIYGQEWNPILPYYAERKAAMETTLATRQEMIDRANRIWAKEPRIGAVIRCPSSRDDGDPSYEAIFKRWKLDGVRSCSVWFRP